MSMQAIRGLEMVCLTRTGSFELNYIGGGQYADPMGEPIADLMDMGCMGCSVAYYTRESSPIEFCPACGFMERKRFTSFHELQGWSTDQNWSFLKRNNHHAFGVSRGEQWNLVFALSRDAIESSGYYEDVRDLLGGIERE